MSEITQDVNVLQTHVIHVNDTRIPLAVQLVRKDGTVVDLTGLTVKFKMRHAATGTVKVAETTSGVTVTTAASGHVQYDFPAAAVDTVGIYYAYFVVYQGSEADTFPVDTGRLVVRVDGD